MPSHVDRMEQLTNILHSPNLVARIQKFFGVELTDHLDEKNTTAKHVHQSNDDVSSTTLPRRRQLSSGNGLRSKALDYKENEKTTHLENHPSVSYVIRNRFWYYLFSFGASLGYEVFYATFFSVWFWNIDTAVGRRMILLWVTVMYVGQALKDVIRWPRPASPPVVSLEPEYAMEYGMPSTHAMVGIALPFSMVIFTHNRYIYPLWIGVVSATLWCLLVCGSRLYLGMHSVLDIIAGLVLSSILMVVLVPLIDLVAQWHLTSPYSPFATILVITAMSLFYPKSDRWSPARGDTSVIMGAGSGILLGSWLNYQLGIIRGPGMEPPFPIQWPGMEVAILAVLRAIIGIVCVLGSRFAGKLVGLNFLCWLRGLDSSDPQIQKRVSVEVPNKLITYMSLGLTVTFLSPCVFRHLNIERLTMFTEV